MKQFSFNDLCDMGYGDSTLRKIEETIIDHHRWTVVYRTIFEDIETGKFYEWIESRPATEMQDYGRVSGDEMEDCAEVFPHYITAIAWRSEPSEVNVDT